MIVKKHRLKRGWSQQQLAEMSGVTTRTIQRIEKGHRPSVETSKALAAVFEVEFLELVNEEYSDSTIQIEESERLSFEEQEAMSYAKRIREFYQVAAGYSVIAPAFFVLFQGSVVMFWILAAIGFCIVLQGLIAFELIGFLNPNFERKLAEKRLKRKL